MAQKGFFSIRCEHCGKRHVIEAKTKDEAIALFDLHDVCDCFEGDLVLSGDNGNERYAEQVVSGIKTDS